MKIIKLALGIILFSGGVMGWLDLLFKNPDVAQTGLRITHFPQILWLNVITAIGFFLIRDRE